jgi:hypothetical protein
MFSLHSYATSSSEGDHTTTTNENMARILISYQAFDGSFTNSEQLTWALGSDYKGLMGELRHIIILDSSNPAVAASDYATICMTILVAVFFEEKLKDCKELWELIVEKAWGYVKGKILDSTIRDWMIAKTRSALGMS